MADVGDVLFETIILQDAVSRWNNGDRLAVAQAVSSCDLLIVRLHRLRDAVVKEARDYDRRNKPYDDRD